MKTPMATALAVPADLDKLAREFKRIAPEDGKLIDRLVRDARRCAPLEPPLDNPVELMTLHEKIRTGTSLSADGASHLQMEKSPDHHLSGPLQKQFLREALQAIASNEHMSALVLVMLLAFRTRNNTGFVAGGSWDFAMAIADRYTRLGGTLRYKAKVTSVKVENNRAVGVECADGTVVPASIVVSCADGHTTIFKMLDGRFVDKRIRYLYETLQTVSGHHPGFVGNQENFPRRAAHAQPAAAPAAPRGRPDATRPPGSRDVRFRLGALPGRHHRHDSQVADQLRVLDAIQKERPQPLPRRKKSVIQEIVAILDKRFPGLTQHIERSDIATPATFVRYTGNWQGSYEGWLPTPRILGRRISYTLPGLKNFYMAGHWVVAGGGLPSAALSGRYAAQMICAQNGIKFAPAAP